MALFLRSISLLSLICSISLVSDEIYARLDESTSNPVRCELYPDKQEKDSLGTESIEDDSLPAVENCATDTSYCFVLWYNNSQNIRIMKKGCFGENCDGHKTCISSEIRKNVLFCCCEGNLCNANFTYEPSSALVPAVMDDEFVEEDIYLTLTVKMILLFAGVILISFVAFYKLRCSKQNDSELAERAYLPSAPAIIETFQPIDFIECKAEGKFGAVWKAKMKNNIVAVKIVPAKEKQSWLTEKKIFQLPFIEHDNILSFLGAEKRGDNVFAEYLLITAYHELGSLNDYLKTNTVTIEELYIISFTMARGLSHLHEEINSNKPEFRKPSIAHRDFKSSNVLLKNDLSACIADFGLALVFESQTCTNTQSQVGTKRYMAPEVLEGIVNFSCSSFLRIDMYAFGLVLWEILSRCTADEGGEDEYKLPFQAQLGDHPTMEELRDFVVYKHGRPTLKDTWNKHPILSQVCIIIEECLDGDADARISSACVTERLSSYLQSTLKNEAKLLYNIVSVN